MKRLEVARAGLLLNFPMVLINTVSTGFKEPSSFLHFWVNFER